MLLELTSELPAGSSHNAIERILRTDFGKDLLEGFRSELSSDSLDDLFFVVGELLGELLFCGVSDDLLQRVRQLLVELDFGSFLLQIGDHVVLRAVHLRNNVVPLLVDFAQSLLLDTVDLLLDAVDA